MLPRAVQNASDAILCNYLSKTVYYTKVTFVNAILAVRFAIHFKIHVVIKLCLPVSCTLPSILGNKTQINSYSYQGQRSRSDGTKV